ncbi:endo alpha-1,4 polygalactosaminidase precursor [Paraphaeosphaeria sporulosa]|uniref:alpha-galactosidase n=1 Tax=Paraphaeosphaeria sporulosa TaxID=1460663 RepID=A0A177CE60_9PLEO|nr:endo alpha-1,4 polygalactosaminidase precursor [Paraphaeosphaeria sporulosa]OAG05914.1 endo alpha-1,4 polygalactosaminidase precursor [Paraphaeosphaeria sporulosa]
MNETTVTSKKLATRRPWSLRRKLILGGALALAVLALALGLGLGLTIGREHDSDDDGNGGGDNGSPAPTSSPLPTPTGNITWTPKVNDTWQIILQSNMILDKDATSVTPDVAVYDIDLFDTPAETIATLHRLGKKVICYFSGGSYEPRRPDSGDFKEEDMGKELDGWPGERWLKLGSENVRGIMKKRVELAGKKGCDGVDPDNVDGFQNDNGLGLTAADSIAFMAYLSNLTVPLHLALGLKNAGDIIAEVLPIVHFSVNEQCVEESECDTFAPFVAADKPVFHIEYPDGAGDQSGLKKSVVQKYCGDQGAAAGSGGFSTVLKKMDLDGWVEYCDEAVRITAVNSTDSAR